jgi:hypothetical protein
MTAEVAPALADALRSQDSLQVLNLNDVALGDEGIESIAEVRPQHCDPSAEYPLPVFPQLLGRRPDRTIAEAHCNCSLEMHHRPAQPSPRAATGSVGLLWIQRTNLSGN